MPTDRRTIEARVDGPIGQLVLNQPRSLNPLSATCLQELIDAATWFNARPEVKAVVVSGAGRAFCAGADLSTFGDTGIGTNAAAGTGAAEVTGHRSARESADLGRLMVEAIERMEAVTIAAVHGHCVGGGVLLAAACDLRLATESTRWIIPEVDIGIPLAWGGIPRLVREIGPAATRDLVITCRPFTSAEAFNLGLLNEVVDDDQLTERADELAELVASKSALTLKATLRAVDAAAEALVPTGGCWSDADALLSATRDPESREVAARYLRDRIRG